MPPFNASDRISGFPICFVIKMTAPLEFETDITEELMGVGKICETAHPHPNLVERESANVIEGACTLSLIYLSGNTA